MATDDCEHDRDCPKCKRAVVDRLKGQPWPLLLCVRCLGKEKKRNNSEARVRRLQGAASGPPKLENPTLKPEDLTSDMRKWLTSASIPVEMLESWSAPYGHALVACNAAKTARDRRREASPSGSSSGDESSDDESQLPDRPRKTSRGSRILVIGGLPRNVKMKSIEGLVRDFRHEYIPFIRRNDHARKSGASCWTMVGFYSSSDAESALKQLDGKTVSGLEVSARMWTEKTFSRAQHDGPGRTLWIKGIGPGVTEEMLLKFMDDFDARVHCIQNGYAIVELPSAAEAQRAIECLHKQKIMMREISVQINRNPRHEPVPEALRALTPVEQSVFSDSASRTPLSSPHAKSSIRCGSADEDIDTMSHASDSPSTGGSPRPDGGQTGAVNNWVSGVLNEILKMEMASRPSSWLDVSLSVQRELQHQLMMDITEGDSSEGTPISIPLLELLGQRVEALRQL